MSDTAALVRVLDEFVWVLRREGFPVSIAQASDVVRAVAALGFERMTDVRTAVAAVVLQRRHDRRRFEETFDAFFCADQALARRPTLWIRLKEQGFGASEIDAARLLLEHGCADAKENAASLRTLLEGGSPLDRVIAGAGLAASIEAHSGLQLGFRAHRLLAQLGVSPARRTLADLRERLTESLGTRGRLMADALARELRLFEEEIHRHVRARYEGRVRDLQRERKEGGVKMTPFAALSPTDFEDVRRAVQRFAEALRGTVHVRSRRAVRSGGIDAHRTLRAALPMGGVPFALVRKPRRTTRSSVVVLCDVSDSVREVATLLLEFTYAIQRLLPRSKSFVFVSDLAEATDLFKSEPAPVAIDNAWQGSLGRRGQNSNYGRVFREFEARYLREIDQGTTIIIVGDGRSNYLPPHADVLERLRRRSRALLWICPEPRGRWGQSDSAMGLYEPACTAVYEVICAADLERVARLLVTCGWPLIKARPSDGGRFAPAR